MSMMEDIPQDQNKDIKEAEDRLKSIMEDYQLMLGQISDINNEDELAKCSATAETIAANLLTLQKSMHKIVDTFVSMEEPQFVDRSEFPEFSADLPVMKKEIFERYNKEISQCTLLPPP
eukprot:TRINITY_DN16914_c0_g1_i2.p2 TRINITY_DN16914_c0_g1~~TRINITY_DN16914_c0_g1_i2.p2  ORF type:complete len:119 (+),score=39.90 TRINITY_DN16914_c0_g1_i2:74-430(+)